MYVVVAGAAERAFAQGALSNPLLPSGADPYSFYKDGYYYYTNSLGDRIDLWKTRSLADLRTAERKTIFKPGAGLPYSHELWAPEVMFLRGKWYAYVAADDGSNDHHRLYVLENPAADPMEGTWVVKGKISDPSDKWAIDADVIDYRGQLYMTWSGWEGDTNGEQDIYIARLSNPWTVAGPRVRISRPTYTWERHGDLHNAGNPPHVSVNEGPQFLAHGDRMFIVFSASGCWTDFYSLGLLSLSGSDLLDPAAWTKRPEPVFTEDSASGVYAPGHNSFFTSPDGSQYWILYHANSEPDQGCGGHRSPRAQPFTWNADGTPAFGKPVRTGALP
jgi:GH43 family beta-xylosidase